MKLKIKPSLRIKKRYLLLEGEKEEVEKAILDYVGILGWARAGVVFVKTKNNKLVLGVDRKEIEDIRAALELSNKSIKVLRVSGTIKGLQRTF